MRTLAALLFVCAAVALADNAPAETIALGYMTETADAVLVVTAGSAKDDGSTLFRVDEVLRGELRAQQVTVRRAPTTPGWEVDGRYLAFLRRTDDDSWVPLHPLLGLRRLVDGEPGIPFPQVVREIASTIDAQGKVNDPDRLRALLVSWMIDKDSGVSWSAATDFVRHTELHTDLTSDQTAAILAAYAREPIGKVTKKALALAVAATRSPGAGDLLVDSLLLPRSEYIRIPVTEALRRLADTRVPARIETVLKKADEQARVSLLIALGQLDGATALRVGRAYLTDPSPRVRPVAAHTLGLGSRALRKSNPDTEREGRTELEAMLKTARTENEIRAGLWALAQLDQPEAYAVLRHAADKDTREVARRFAARYLMYPRHSLILWR